MVHSFPVYAIVWDAIAVAIEAQTEDEFVSEPSGGPILTGVVLGNTEPGHYDSFLESGVKYGARLSVLSSNPVQNARSR